MYLALHTVPYPPCWCSFVLIQCCVCDFVIIISIDCYAWGLKAINTWLGKIIVHVQHSSAISNRISRLGILFRFWRKFRWYQLHAKRGPGGHIEEVYGLSNQRALRFSYLNEIHIFEHVGEIFYGKHPQIRLLVFHHISISGEPCTVYRVWFKWLRPRDLTYCSHKPQCTVMANPDRSVLITIITWHF